MTPQDYQRATELFNRLRDASESERSAVLDSACAGDTALRVQVMRLLEADRGAGSFLERGAMEDAARLLPPDTPQLPAPGTVIRNYRLASRIGAGGMGVVYEGEDLRLHRRVAIKVLLLPHALNISDTTADRVKRFQQEARAASLLNHPNIVSIYDADLDQGHYYIAMEFVEGQTLRHMIAEQGRGSDPHTLLELISQSASALNAAHQSGILHRDIKPENIMVRPDGIVKVLDFGLAKLKQPSFDSPTAASELHTRPGVMPGTIQYLSPEQVAGKPADFRSDVFSLGVVFYELATGVRPFDGPSDAAVYDAILHRNPERPSVVVPGLSRELDSLILRSLEKDPDLRFQTASDLRSACKRLNRDISGLSMMIDPPREPVKPRRSTVWAAVAAVCVLVLAACLWVWGRSSTREADRAMLQLDLDVGEEVSQLAVSADGLELAFVLGNRLAIRRLDGANITPLEGTDGAASPFFSPDGQWLAFFARGKLQKIPVTGGAPVTICEAPSPRGGSWGDDGYIVAALSSTSGLYRASSSGGTPELIAAVKADGRGVSGYRWMQTLPGGKGVLFVTNTGGGTIGALQVLSPRDHSVKTLVEHCAFGRYLGDGHLVYYQRGRLFTVPIDLERLQLTGHAEQLVDGVAADAARGAVFESSLTGTLIYRRGPTGAPLSWRSADGSAEPIGAPDGPYVTPRLSPDGKRMALAMADLQNLWIYNLDRKTMSRLTFDPEPQFMPVWTPDGEFVVFRSGDELAWVRSDGGGKLERWSGVRAPLPSSFSPDGKWLVFAGDNPPTGWDIWVAPVEHGKGTFALGTPRALRAQPGGQYAPMISPDGRWMAYASDESGRAEIYVVPFAPDGGPRTGKWQVSRDGGVYPLWSQRGHEVFFRSPDRHVMAAGYEAKGDSFVHGTPRVWTPARLDVAGGFPSFDFAGDGRAAGFFESGTDMAETHLRVLLNVNDELRRRERSGSKTVF